jgi:hypothetical protein
MNYATVSALLATDIGTASNYSTFSDTSDCVIVSYANDCVTNLKCAEEMPRESPEDMGGGCLQFLFVQPALLRPFRPAFFNRRSDPRWGAKRRRSKTYSGRQL